MAFLIKNSRANSVEGMSGSRMNSQTSLSSSSSGHSKLSDDYGSLEDSSQIESNIEHHNGVEYSIDVGKEVELITKTSVPLMFTFFLQYSLTVVSIFSVGHIGTRELAAVSLATMTFNVTSSIFNGMSTSLDTLCPQAYGAGVYVYVGLYFQRCVAMISVINIPLVTLWWYSGSFFKLIVTDIELAKLAQGYLRVMTAATPAYILFETGKRYLQAQGIFSAGQNILFIAVPLNISLNYIFVFDENIGIGFLGAPLASVVSYWVMAILLLTYGALKGQRRCWGGLQIKEAFSNWGELFSLSINGALMLLSEFIAFEILTLSSARFGTEVLAAQSICSTLATLAFQVPFATSVAVSTRLSFLIGGRKEKESKTVIKISYYMSLVLGITNFLLLFFLKMNIISLFTSDKRVAKNAAGILAILALNQLYDCPNIIGAGCLRAQGRQYIGGRLNLVAYYLIAIPLATYFGFYLDFEVKGLWTGLGIGIVFLALSEFYFVHNVSWNKVFDAASKRNGI